VTYVIQICNSKHMLVTTYIVLHQISPFIKIWMFMILYFDWDWVANFFIFCGKIGKTWWEKDVVVERHTLQKRKTYYMVFGHNTELRKGITHLARNECIIYWKIFYQILFSTKDVNYVLTLETKIIQKPTIWFELRNYVQVQNRKDMVNII